MQTSLRGIARRAKQEREYRFGNLYGMIDKQALYEAWKNIKKKSAAGIDKETAEEFSKNLEDNIETMLTELQCKGEAYICRVADDFICAFRYKEDADKLYRSLGKRLGKFSLELAEDKTKTISFS